MNERSIYLIAALAGGATVPVQVAVNTLLGQYVDQPMQLHLSRTWQGHSPRSQFALSCAILFRLRLH